MKDIQAFDLAAIFSSNQFTDPLDTWEIFIQRSCQPIEIGNEKCVARRPNLAIGWPKHDLIVRSTRDWHQWVRLPAKINRDQRGNTVHVSRNGHDGALRCPRLRL